MGDRLTQQGRLDLVAKVIEHAKKNGLVAGVACHSIEVPIACEKAGLPVDFYMKTLHSPHYWSATPEDKKGPFDLPRHDNMWCMEPERTIEFMKTCEKPWIAYKVLAAGAIQPSRRLPIRLRERRRLRLRRHVRLPGPRRRHHRQQDPDRHEPPPPLAYTLPG